MTEGFTTATRAEPAGPVLAFTGELDAATAPTALTAIQALTLHRGEQLVVDLSALEFCDSSGISALLAARNLALAADAVIALVGVPRQLQRSLKLIGLAAFFPAFTTIEDARRGLSEED